MEVLNNYSSFDSAYEVDDYPYGFRLRTKIRYWIESNKKGDRFVSCTLNPKTGNWNKPKKSTYSDIKVMYLNKDNHVKTDGINIAYSDVEEMDSFLGRVGIDNLTDKQKETVKLAQAVYKARKHITVEVKPVVYRHKVTGEETTQIDIFRMGEYEQVSEHQTEEEKEKVMQKARGLVGYYLNN